MNINGMIYDYMGITLKLDGIIFNDLESINYTSSNEVEVSTNMQGRINGWGRREYSASGSMALAFSDYLKLKKIISQNGILPFYSDKKYTVEVSYGSISQELITDVFDVVITGEENSNSKGNTKKLVTLTFAVVSDRGIKTVFEDGLEVFSTEDLRRRV